MNSAVVGVQGVVPGIEETPNRGSPCRRDFATELITPGPFWFSALKFDIVTLNSEIMSEFGFTGVSQLQPGSESKMLNEVSKKKKKNVLLD